MVKLIGPMQSARASGTLAGQLTFGFTGKTPTLRKKPNPRQPRTGKQVSMRAMIKFLTRQWKRLSKPDQATWAQPYRHPCLPDYNAYLKHNLKRWRSFLAPSQTFPINAVLPPNQLWTDSAPGYVRHAIPHLDIITGLSGWGAVIFRSQTPAFITAYDNAIAVIQTTGAGPWTYTDTPLDPGVYYYSERAFSIDGTMWPHEPTHVKQATVT